MSDKKYYSAECSWKDTTMGGVIPDAGNAVEFKTGDWRSMKPVWNAENCKNCLLCWAVCPDMSILVEHGKIKGIDYDHCKGCGLCVSQCKFKALSLVKE
ncbi:4Fe-4S binding protein [Clostridium estertheticum]|uniref:4Fe-4S binding protein n=1 Tax=Clostridium estertheticum TaxID=238834 RepID=UPI001C7DB2B5|nr:4Fe-4S binding protein [Clostridium estertheticum]MBX4264512.1 4Fe-4S binding protein [Clostridium estertheticum]WLC88659.1 4Fe-4S binding protein [Clostridium estertheticum]